MAKFSCISCFLILISTFLFNVFCQAATDIGIYELKRGSLSVKITNYGAAVISVVVPDRNGLFTSSLICSKLQKKKKKKK